MSRDEIVRRMESKYRDELDLYRVLHGVCLEQHRAAKNGQMKEVVRLSQVKSDLMKQISALESEIQALRSELRRIDSNLPQRHGQHRLKGLA